MLKTKERDMEKKAWTARGTMGEADKLLIEALAKRDRAAARIFVTGEAHESYIGDAAARLLVDINDTLYQNGVSQEPLFVRTAIQTVRMTRFDPAFVWRCFHPDILVGLVKEEAARFAVKMDPFDMEEFDFYQSAITALAEKVGDSVPIAWKDSDADYFYNAAYLSCLLLFRKPGYMDVPVAAHFAPPAAVEFMKFVDYRPLEASEREALRELRKQYGRIQGLTNPEMLFALSLFERNRK